ncbi:MAG TPA: helicase-related protein [Victivallales bacterium]|nr:helicase-related protein [Victivallales bacterium]
MDNLGIDSIFADEAHNFKNIAVRQELVKSGLGISFAFNNNDNVSLKSARSYDFRFKCNYIADKNNGNNIFLLTATPTPNKPLEVYTMLRHLDSDILNEYGIYSDLQFSNAFFEFGTVKDIRNSEKTKSILSKIINAVELRNIINRFIDKKNIIDLNIQIPKENINNHYLDKSINYELVEQELRDRQENLSSSIEAGEDTHIAIYTNGRNASIDPRLYYGAHAITNIDDRTHCNSDDKIELTIDLISKKLLDNPKCGQLLFLDVAGYSKVEFGCMDEDLHREIKRLVIERTGIEKKQIAIMTGQYITNLKTGNDIRTPSGDKKDKLKQDISDSFNAGEIKLIIGSTQSMGEGMDLQINTTDVYNLDFPYNSAALRQRKGRAIRYGNINGSVNVHYFFMKGTFDSLSYDLISKKKGWNSALWDKEATEEISTREEMQGGSMPSSEQIQIELESDPLIKEMLKKEYSYKLMLEEKEAVFISLHRSKTKLDSKKRFLSSLLETKSRKEALIKQKQNESNLNDEKVIKLIYSYSKNIEVLNEKIDFTLNCFVSISVIAILSHPGKFGGDNIVPVLLFKGEPHEIPNI